MAARGRPKIGRPAFTRLDAQTETQLRRKCKRLKLKTIAEGIRAAVKEWVR